MRIEDKFVIFFSLSAIGAALLGYSLVLPPVHILATVIDGTGVHANVSTTVPNEWSMPLFIISIFVILTGTMNTIPLGLQIMEKKSQ